MDKCKAVCTMCVRCYLLDRYIVTYGGCAWSTDHMCSAKWQKEPSMDCVTGRKIPGRRLSCYSGNMGGDCELFEPRGDKPIPHIKKRSWWQKLLGTGE